MRIGVGKDDAIQWVSVAVFGKAAETAVQLKKSDRCYIEGTIKIEYWKSRDGVDRHGLSVAAFKCEPTHRIGRQRKRKSAAGEVGRPLELATDTSAELNDEIPF